MARHKVDICGVNTANIKVLSYNEQMDLFKRFNNGDLNAKEDLVNGNLKLVLSILKPFSGRCDNMDDLFQVGTIGLIKAIDNFDLSHGVKFSTYAVPMILGEVKRFLRDNNSVRISRSVKDLAYKCLKVKEKFLNEESREPSSLEIADILGVSEFEVCNALNSLKDTVSMYEPIYNDGGDTIYLYDQIEDTSSSNDFLGNLIIQNAIDDLAEREKHILDERFVVGKSQMEIADELQISQAQVSRLEKKAIKQLKKVLK